MAVTGADQRQRLFNIGLLANRDVYAVGSRGKRQQRRDGLTLGVEGGEVCADGDDLKRRLILSCKLLNGTVALQLSIDQNGGAVAERFDIRENM